MVHRSLMKGFQSMLSVSFCLFCPYLSGFTFYVPWTLIKFKYTEGGKNLRRLIGSVKSDTTDLVINYWRGFTSDICLVILIMNMIT